MSKIKLIIDCDPGIDDVIALSFAVANEDKFDILGITTVAGNQSIEKVTDNARRLMSYYGKDIKIAQGQAGPLLREKRDASSVHGENGIGDYKFPEPKTPLYSDNAVVFMRDILMNSDSKVAIAAVGPLTNIALLIKTFPEVKEKIEVLTIMGGAIYGGNVTEVAEFNIWADPEAARIVFDSKLPIVMSGLNVTHNSVLHREDVDTMMNGDGNVTSVCGKIVDYYFLGDHVNNKKYTPMHDSCAIMYLIHPEIYEYKHMKVTVDCGEELSRGNTIVDIREFMSYDTTYPKVLTSVDSDKFRDILLKSLYKLDETLQIVK